jgi:hypothetical protein
MARTSTKKSTEKDISVRNQITMKIFHCFADLTGGNYDFLGTWGVAPPI